MSMFKRITHLSATRLQVVSLGLSPISGYGLHVLAPVTARKRGAVIAMASADAQEPGTEGGGEPEAKESKIEVQNLPLESKEQLKLEQKMRIKMEKKIRLHRKRLLRKRRMRKKGRWPPSKMKKLKNV